MKKQPGHLLAPISPKLLHSLLIQVKETIAREASPEMTKMFTTGDLWRIRRQARQFIRRRYIF